VNIAPENTFHTLPEAFTQPDRVESLYLHDDHLTALPRPRRLALEYCREVYLPCALASVASLSELLVPHCLKFGIEEGFVPPPHLALLSVPKWTLDDTTRARLDAALPKKLWSGRNERNDRVYRRKAPKASRVP